MFIVTSLTLPPASATARSSAGASCLQGPHQGAQKSTNTGVRSDSVITSCQNEAVVTSFAPAARAPAAVSFSPSIAALRRSPSRTN